MKSIVFDNLLFGHREFVRWGELVEGDIRDAAALDAVFNAQRIDAVMHFAALAYVGESVKAPGLYYDVNMNGTRVLLDAMVRADVRAIVFSSSCAIYGEPDHIPIVESTRPDPINPYGFTKLACERMMDDFDRAHGLKSVRLRYFNAAGADLAAEIGEDHQPETHLIPLVLDAALGRTSEIQVFGTDYQTPDGTAFAIMCMCPISPARIYWRLSMSSGAVTRSLLISRGAGASVREVIDTARAATGRKFDARDVERRPGDLSILVADAMRARELLEWSAERSDLATIIADAWHWHKRFGHKGST